MQSWDRGFSAGDVRNESSSTFRANFDLAGDPPTAPTRSSAGSRKDGVNGDYGQTVEERERSSKMASAGQACGETERSERTRNLQRSGTHKACLQNCRVGEQREAATSARNDN